MKKFFLFSLLIASLSACGSGDDSSPPGPVTYTIFVAESGVRAPVRVAINGEVSQTLQAGQRLEYTSQHAPSEWDWQVESLSKLQGCAQSGSLQQRNMIEITCQDSLWFFGGGNSWADQGDLGWYSTDGTATGTWRIEDPTLRPYKQDVFSNGLRILEKEDDGDADAKRFWLTDGSSEGTSPAPWSEADIRSLVNVSEDLYLLRVSETQGSTIQRITNGESEPSHYISLPDLDEGLGYEDLIAMQHGLVIIVSSAGEEAAWPAKQVGQFYMSEFSSTGSLFGPFPLLRMGVTPFSHRLEKEASAYVTWSDGGKDSEGQPYEGDVMVVDRSQSSPRYVGLPPVSAGDFESISFDPRGIVDGKLVASLTYDLEGVTGSCLSLYLLEGEEWELLRDFCDDPNPQYWRSVKLDGAMLYGITEQSNGASRISIMPDVLEPLNVQSLAEGQLEGWPDRVLSGDGQIYIRTLDDEPDAAGFAPWMGAYRARVYSLDLNSLNVTLLANGLTPSAFGFAGFTLSYPYTMNGKLIFGLASKEAGFEPWVTDGSKAGTRLMTELLPGVGHGLDPMFMDLFRGFTFWYN